MLYQSYSYQEANITIIKPCKLFPGPAGRLSKVLFILLFQTTQVRSSFLHTQKRHSQTQAESDARLLNPTQLQGHFQTMQTCSGMSLRTQYRDILEAMQIAVCLFIHNTEIFKKLCRQRYVSSYTTEIFRSYADNGMSLHTQY